MESIQILFYNILLLWACCLHHLYFLIQLLLKKLNPSPPPYFSNVPGIVSILSCTKCVRTHIILKYISTLYHLENLPHIFRVIYRFIHSLFLLNMAPPPSPPPPPPPCTSHFTLRTCTPTGTSRARLPLFRAVTVSMFGCTVWLGRTV